MLSRRFVLCVVAVVAARPARSESVPQARFEDGLVFIDVPAPDHSSLHLLAAGNAGQMLLSTDAAGRLQLRLSSTEDPEVLAQLGPAAKVGEATPFMQRYWPAIPASTGFLVVPGVVAVKGWAPTADGVLGRAWFAGHAWTWDYPRRQLVRRDRGWRATNAGHALPISFEPDHEGDTASFAQVAITVDGQEIAVRLNMGESTVLSPSALQELHDGRPALRAASMLAHGVFETLRARHPKWRVIEDGTLTGQRMLLVPTAELAGIGAGPVWFIEGTDEDNAIRGSIGGNLLSRFVISIDYPRSRAWAKLKLSRH
jgi:hypothetical protein